MENQAWKEVNVSELDLGKDNNNIWYVGVRTQVPMSDDGKPIPQPREVRNIPTYAFMRNSHFSAIVNGRSPVTKKSVFNIKSINDLFWAIKNMDAQTYLDKLENLLPSNGTKHDKLILAEREVEKLKTFLFGGYKVHIDDIFHMPGVKMPKSEKVEKVTRRTRKKKEDTKEETTLDLNLDND